VGLGGRTSTADGGYEGAGKKKGDVGLARFRKAGVTVTALT
jgi:hypothetical protein